MDNGGVFSSHSLAVHPFSARKCVHHVGLALLNSLREYALSGGTLRKRENLSRFSEQILLNFRIQCPVLCAGHAAAVIGRAGALETCGPR